MKLENILTHGRSSSTIKTLNDYKKFASSVLVGKTVSCLLFDVFIRCFNFFEK